MATNRELKISRHVNRWPSRMGGLFVISLLLTGSILWGCSALAVNSYHTLSVSELEAQISSFEKREFDKNRFGK